MTNEIRTQLINELSNELGIDNKTLDNAIDKELDISSLDNILNSIDTDKLENSDSVNIDDVIDTVEFWYIETVETTDNETVETVETTDNETVETTINPYLNPEVLKPKYFVVKVSDKELDLIKTVINIEDVNIKSLENVKSTDNKSTDKSTLDGAAIKGIRNSIGASQEVLAQLLGMSKSSSAAISDWENDRFSIPNKHIDKLLSLTKEKVNMFKESLK